MEKDIKSKTVKTKKVPKKNNRDIIDTKPQLASQNFVEQDSIVLTFARMNPPTIGHQRLVNYMKKLAEQTNSAVKVYLSHSCDSDKNPLQYSDKITLAKIAFGSVVQESQHRNVVDILKELQSKYKSVKLVVGSDQLQEFNRMVENTNNKDYKFDKIEVVSCGDRSGETLEESVSATQARQYVYSNDYESFKNTLPKRLLEYSQEVFDMIISSKKINEQEKLDEFVLNVQQRRKRGLIMRRFKVKLQRAREIARRKLAKEKNLKKRAARAARKLIRKRVAGKRGVQYQTLTPSEKMQVDKLVDKKSAAIKKIANRLLPKVRKAEYARLQSFISGKKMQNLGKKESVENKDLNSLFEQYISNQEVSSDQIINEAIDFALNQLITEKQIQSLEKKSQKSGIDFEILESVFVRGVVDNFGDLNKAFDRVNAFIARSNSAYKDDKDLLETVDQKFSMWLEQDVSVKTPSADKKRIKVRGPDGKFVWRNVRQNYDIIKDQ